jgi:GDSL-like lipase/acylhydrolase family protein
MPIGVSLFTGGSGGAGFARSAYSGRRAVDSATAAGTSFGYAGTATAFPGFRPELWSGSGPANTSPAQITPVPFGFPTQPALAFIGYGINDCANYINPAAYGDAIQRKIIAVRRGVPAANVCLIAFCYPDPLNSDNNLPGNGVHYSRWKQPLAALAATYGCAYVDIDAKWGATPVAQGFQQSGNVHPTQAGSADIANVIAGIL